MVDVQGDEGFGEATKFLEDGVEGAVLAVFEDDVQVGRSGVVASVLDNVAVCVGERVRVE